MLDRVRHLFRHSRAHGRALATKWLDTRQRLTAHGFDGSRARVLEIGCGRLYPYTLMFGSDGVRTVGTDIIPLWRHAGGPSRYLRLTRSRGALSAARNLAADLMVRPALYGELARCTGLPLNHSQVQLATMDATRLAFGDGQFDACVSIAAFEHIPDVPAAVREMARVLVPGALAHVEIHLFPSLTGGHDRVLSDQADPPAGFELWGHLLNRSWRSPVGLNRYRECQFLAALMGEFEILERVVTSTHGSAFLTEAIVERLPEFTADELVTETVALLLRRAAR